MKKEDKETQEKEEGYSVVEVPVQMGLAFKNPEGQLMDSEALLLDLANRVYKIEKIM